MKKVFLLVSMALLASGGRAQTPQNVPVAASADLTRYGVKIEPDKRLLVVMAALDAAGLEMPVTETGKGFRDRLRADAQNLNPALRERLKAFLDGYRNRRASASAEELSAPFVSLAYALSPAPDLGDPVNKQGLPEDVLEVLDFAPLVREFYRTARMNEKLPEYARLYQAEADRMRSSAARMTTDLLDYLHTKPELVYVERVKRERADPKNPKKKVEVIESRPVERQFYIVPELLAPAGTVNFRNVGDEYYAVVPPGTDLTRSDVRRAFLQFVLDPLVLKTAKDIFPHSEAIKNLLEARRAAGAAVSPDVFLAVSRSLVAAVDAKEAEYRRVNEATADARRRIDLAQGTEAKRAVSAELARLKQTFADETALQLSDAYERGAVLAFYFAERLKGIEDSGFDIAGSFRDMILSFDASKETARLAQFAEARNRAAAARKQRRSVPTENTEAAARRAALAKSLEAVETIIRAQEAKKPGEAKDYAEADARLQKLLEENPSEPSIHYALGRVASLWAATALDEAVRDDRLTFAKLHYNNAIRTANVETDPKLIQLSYVALGRIFEFYDENINALKHFEEAINIGREADANAFNEALAGRQRLTKQP